MGQDHLYEQNSVYKKLKQERVYKHMNLSFLSRDKKGFASDGLEGPSWDQLKYSLEIKVFFIPAWTQFLHEHGMTPLGPG